MWRNFNNDLTQLFKFFLVGVETTCQKAISGIQTIVALQKQYREMIFQLMGKEQG